MDRSFFINHKKHDLFSRYSTHHEKFRDKIFFKKKMIQKKSIDPMTDTNCIIVEKSVSDVL